MSTTAITSHIPPRVVADPSCPVEWSKCLDGVAPLVGAATKLPRRR